MDEALLLERGERPRHRLDDLQGGEGLHRSAPGKDLEEVLPLDELHGQVVVLAVPPRIDGVDEVGMAQARERPGLLEEPPRDLRVVRKPGEKDLERDSLLQADVACLEDAAHAAEPHPPDDLVVADPRALEGPAQRLPERADMLRLELLLLEEHVIDGLLEAESLVTVRLRERLVGVILRDEPSREGQSCHLDVGSFHGFGARGNEVGG
jgi:hypothetical protein